MATHNAYFAFSRNANVRAVIVAFCGVAEPSVADSGLTHPCGEQLGDQRAG